jgi:hypothetical protein
MRVMSWGLIRKWDGAGRYTGRDPSNPGVIGLCIISQLLHRGCRSAGQVMTALREYNHADPQCQQ